MVNLTCRPRSWQMLVLAPTTIEARYGMSHESTQSVVAALSRLAGDVDILMQPTRHHHLVTAAAVSLYP